MKYLRSTIPEAYALLEQITVHGISKRTVVSESSMFLLKHYQLAAEIVVSPAGLDTYRGD